MPLTRKNYLLLAIGFLVVLTGFVLMTGGAKNCASASRSSPS